MIRGMEPPVARIGSAELETWLRFFRSRRDRVIDLPWRDEGPLRPEDRKRIGASIATFQLGESSDGAHLIAAARSFGRNAIARKRSSWSDRVFRSLRRLGGFETAISVLIVAELIALTYYRALAVATPSRVLRRICELIVADERAHVTYEGGLINGLRARRSRTGRLFASSLHSILFAGAVVVVYAGHRRVLRAGGYGLPRFWVACWTSFGEFVGRAPAPRAERFANASKRP